MKRCKYVRAHLREWMYSWPCLQHETDLAEQKTRPTFPKGRSQTNTSLITAFSIISRMPLSYGLRYSLSILLT